MDIAKGMGLLLLTLIIFSGISLKAPKGQEAMSGLSGAAISTFLIEAIHKYINGDFLGIGFLGDVGIASGGVGGIAAAILVSLNMGANPVFAVTAGAAMAGYGILPGFIAGYAVGMLAPVLEKKLPKGVDVIFGALLIAPVARFVGLISAPVVDSTLVSIGNMVSVAAVQSPYLMGFLLGGIMKVMCTSPLSSMAVTAMLGLQGLAMGISSISCVGGSFTNGIVFKKLKLGDSSQVMGVMLEPLTQADVVTQNAVPIYGSNFLGGGLAGIAAAHFKIINNAPGTASPIPGLIAPFGFNSPSNVLLAMGFAIAGGIMAGLIGSMLTKLARRSQQNTALIDS